MSDSVDWDAASEGAEFSGNSFPSGGSTTRTRTGGAPRGRRVSDKRLDALQQKLSSEMFQAGTMMGLGLPVTGYYVCQESDTFTSAVVALAAKNSNWVAALENLALIGPGIAIGRTVVGIGAALAADRYHRTEGASGLDPDRRAAMFLGVTSAYYAVHPPEGFDASNTGGGRFAGPPHAGFSPVS